MNDFPQLPALRRLGKPVQVSNPSRVGTASFEDFSKNEKPMFKRGDFWMSYAEDGTPLGASDDRHVLINGGTRSGKGTDYLIPNLLLWQGSVVVIDPKGENAKITARRRADGSAWANGMGQKVVILDPFDVVETFDDDFADLKGGYNPLTLINADKEQSVDDAARIADALVVAATTDAFFSESARHLLQMLILHVGTWRGYAEDTRNLMTVRALVSAGDLEARAIAKAQLGDEAPSALHLLFDSMMDNPAFGGIIVRAATRYSDLLKESPRTFMGVLQTACTNTDLFDSPGMARVLNRSDFAMHELKTRPEGMTLYLCLPQRLMETHFRWLRMMTTLGLTEMERWQFQPVNNYPVLMVLDEFASLKRMQSIESAAAQIAGFGVKLMFVTQTLAQLKDVYKDNWETLLASCSTKIFLNVEDQFTRDYVSKLAGVIELRPTTQNSSLALGKTKGFSSTLSVGTTYGSSSGGGGNPSSSSSSTFTRSSTTSTGYSETTTRGTSETIQTRMLLTPDEVGRLFGGADNSAALCLRAGKQPLVMSRVPYHRDRMFRGYYDGHPDHPKPVPLDGLADVLRREQHERHMDFMRLSEDMQRPWRQNASGCA